jgi:uncharacterized DUF497 family protein
MEFEWDAEKEKANRERHGVSFDEAKELLESGVDYLEVYDIEHSDEEDRFVAIGLVRRGLLVVVYTERVENTIRIISARPATKREAVLFERYWEELP